MRGRRSRHTNPLMKDITCCYGKRVTGVCISYLYAVELHHGSVLSVPHHRGLNHLPERGFLFAHNQDLDEGGDVILFLVIPYIRLPHYFLSQ